MGRKQTEETKRKISIALSKPRNKLVCNLCKKTFLTLRKNQKFCGVRCAQIYNNKQRSLKRKMMLKENPSWLSDIQREQYKNGTRTNGGGRTKWYPYNDIRVQGTFELRACKILDLMKISGEIIDWEYTKDRFRYVDQFNNYRTYLIDFKIFTNDGFYYLEVKGWQKDEDFFKWRAVREKGFRLDVWFDQDILKFEKQLAPLV